MAAIGVKSVCLKATFDTIGCCQAFEVPNTSLYGSPAMRLVVDIALGAAAAAPC